MLCETSSRLPPLFAGVPTSCAAAKDDGLPADVLKAHSVRIVISQHDGKQLNNPAADSNAERAVEKALSDWGRFVIVEGDADLVIAVHAGTDKLISPTVEDGSTDTRTSVETADGRVRVFGQQGHAPVISDSPTVDPKHTGPHLGKQVGQGKDSLQVYDGVAYRADSVPIWRYAAKNALKEPDVVAVQQFRKAVAASGNGRRNHKSGQRTLSLGNRMLRPRPHFVYIPHEPCPPSTTGLWNAPSAGRTM